VMRYDGFGPPAFYWGVGPGYWYNSPYYWW
jgi:hypothetical protein